MNCNIFFLKIEKLSEFLTLLSKLFHSVTMDGKYEFLKIHEFFKQFFLRNDCLRRLKFQLYSYDSYQKIETGRLSNRLKTMETS